MWNTTDINVDIEDLKTAYAAGDWRSVIYAVKKIFNFEGASNLQECPAVSVLLGTSMDALQGATTMVNLGLDAMGGMEADF